MQKCKHFDYSMELNDYGRAQNKNHLFRDLEGEIRIFVLRLHANSNEYVLTIEKVKG